MDTEMMIAIVTLVALVVATVVFAPKWLKFHQNEMAAWAKREATYPTKK